MATVSNSDHTLEIAEKFKMNPTKFTGSLSKDFLRANEMTIVHLDSPSSETLELVLELVAAEDDFIKYVVLHPFKISLAHLRPRAHLENPILESLVPPQTFLNFGTQERLDLERDINQEEALLVIENDTDYIRKDKFKTLAEILSASVEANPFVYKYQLAESFMRQVAFKLGRLEKFGA